MEEIKWKAPEFDYYPKSSAWYWWSMLITLAFLVFAIWQKNFLFGFFVVVAEILVLSWGGKKPALVDFSLGEKGLTIGGIKFYPYTELKNWSLPDFEPANPGFVEIILYFKRRLRTNLSIRAPKEQSQKIEEVLKSKAPKVDFNPSFLDIAEKLLKF